jgi:sugar lactone lactonase YvrE
MEKRITLFASFPENTFLENIAINPAGQLFVTSLEEAIIYRLDQDGQRSVFAPIGGKPAGIICLPDESFVVNGWDKAGVPTIYRVSRDGDAEIVAQPEQARFLNGMALLNDRLVLICDAHLGCLWAYDLLTHKTALWLEYALLTKIDLDQFYMPAANGIKVFNGSVYVSNTERRLLLRIPLDHDQPLTPEVLRRDINLDDFAFDEQGNIYAATHIFNSVVKITPGLVVTTIAGEADGLAGSTAVAFGRTALDKDHIYVTTNGGMSLPVDGKIQPARIVKLKVK